MVEEIFLLLFLNFQFQKLTLINTHTLSTKIVEILNINLHSRKQLKKSENFQFKQIYIRKKKIIFKIISKWIER